MKVVELNMCTIGSSGKIMFGIADVALKNGIDIQTYSIRAYKHPTPAPIKHKYMGFLLESAIHRFLAMLNGKNGRYSYFGTRRFIRELRKTKPDIIHLHNLHNFSFCFPAFMRYVKKYEIPLVWTLHDCWTFTGRCPYYVTANCDKWKTGCHDCSYPEKDYPASHFDNSKKMWKLKREWFTGVKNMTLVTPSQWLADQVDQSFLKDYPVKVINNGIDLNVFKPTASDLKDRYNIGKKKIVLGVAFCWDKRKGIDVFVELAKRLDPDKYQIVLIGTTDATDEFLPGNIISIHRTQNQTELAEIYSAADVFANPAREENYPTVNMEALACGTPVVTFKTGGSPEIIDKKTGIVVECGDVDAMEKAVIEVCENDVIKREDCLERAKAFDSKERFLEYVELYREITK